ncbi:hypothetical protein GOQ29_09175 [Clostridium sp. D2Q-14]|uniref:DUF6470 family protein n=1 Tax=Anaeromonas gelatinilytica TaxID=2683194 RepID=UPI00193BB16E|nr:hypothetical protein [Anaeromonas gelatinilytica]
MPLQINTQQGQIGINTHNANIDINTQKGQLNLKQNPAKMNIDGEPVQVIIDQYQCFAEAGLKNNTDLSAEMVAIAKRAVLEGIQRRCEEGDRCAMIGNNMPDAIPEIAENSMMEEKEFGAVTMPKSRPKIDVKGGIKIYWELGGVEAEYVPYKINVDYTPGKVDIYMEKWPEISINYIDEKI